MMTEGIIQEVIRNYISRYPSPLQMDEEDLHTLERELIERIKDYELLSEKDNGRKTRYVMKRSLIGDYE